MKRLALFVCLLPVGLLAQPIEIDWTEIPQQIGTQIIGNHADSVTVALGDTGGPQVWDFTTQPLGIDSSINLIIEPSTAPYFSDSFPASNLVMLGISISDKVADTSYFYRRLVTDSLKHLGLSGTDPTLGDLCLVFRPSPYTTLPLKYKGSMYNRFQFKFKYLGFDIFNEYRIGSYVNAYGTVQTPIGNYECLRICSYDTIRQWIPGIFDTTITLIEYAFVAENYGDVVSVVSYEGETNPNFTDAKGLSRLVSITVVEERAGSPKSNIVWHSPNPFYDVVDIRYSVVEPSVVSLKVYDVSGKVINVLVDGVIGPGEYKVSWSGCDERGVKVPAGVYFYRAQLGKETLSRKLILVRQL